MANQSPEGLTLLITLTIICVAIFITAFSLTFFRKADTGDHSKH